MKILVVDDHSLIREALHGVLHDLKGEVVVFDAANSGQAMQLIAEHADIGLIYSISICQTEMDLPSSLNCVSGTLKSQSLSSPLRRTGVA